MLIVDVSVVAAVERSWRAARVRNFVWGDFRFDSSDVDHDGAGWHKDGVQRRHLRPWSAGLRSTATSAPCAPLCGFPATSVDSVGDGRSHCHYSEIQPIYLLAQWGARCPSSLERFRCFQVRHLHTSLNMLSFLKLDSGLGSWFYSNHVWKLCDWYVLASKSATFWSQVLRIRHAYGLGIWCRYKFDAETVSGEYLRKKSYSTHIQLVTVWFLSVIPSVSNCK